MNDIAIIKRFHMNDCFNREKENFTYTLFEKLDFTKDSEPTSFFRCDFRGAKFLDVKFFMNNFDRADFISCVFIDVIFSKVNIAACEMKNCFFNNAIFTGNLYSNTSIQECTFINCIFENEDLLINMKNSSFINCKIKNCRYERSTTENISFEGCDISCSDFANMHAERYSFKSCVLMNVDIDICYIFGYLFHETNTHNINIIYMGNRIEFSRDNLLNKHASELWEQQRYYEFMNVNIIFQNYVALPTLVEKAFKDIDTADKYLRKLEICNIFALLQFYFTCNVFNFEIVNAVLNILDGFTWEKFDFEEKITYISLFQKLKMYISEYKYDMKFINSAQDSNSIMTFYCDTKNYNLAFKTIKNFLAEVCNTLGLPNSFKFIDAKKGSWILYFVVSSSCALLLPIILKKCHDIFVEINLKTNLNKVLMKKLNKKNISVPEIKMIADIASNSKMIQNKGSDIETYDFTKAISMIKKIVDVIKINL